MQYGVLKYSQLKTSNPRLIQGRVRIGVHYQNTRQRMLIGPKNNEPWLRDIGIARCEILLSMYKEHDLV